MARCGGGSGGGCGGCGEGSRVYPRPYVDLASITTVESVTRTKVDVDSRLGLILGGSVTRVPGDGSNNTETKVNIALWRSELAASGDFIDRFCVCLETTGPELGQGAFAFKIPLEYSHLTVKAFWLTIKNNASSNEYYRVHFDVASLEI